MIHKSKNRLQISENNALLFLAIAVGLLTGIGILIFRGGIDLFHTLFVTTLGDSLLGNALATLGLPRPLSLMIVLALAGFIVGSIMQRFVGHEKYHGVAGIMESVALAGGRLPYWRTPPKAIASMISIGAGASVGPEDPSVQIGSNVGSWIGQRLHLSEERVRLLVSAGAASAVASAFNAPIAGVFFALEIILGEFSARSFGVVVLASVISAGVTQSVRGGNPIFDGMEGFFTGDATQLVFYALLGAMLGVFSVLAIRYHAWQGRVLHDVALSPPIKTALVGAFVGFVGAFFPQILGAGEEFMHGVLTGHLEVSMAMLLFLGVLKLVITSISQGGGFVGGVFAPALFMGIVLGNAYGLLMGSLLPYAGMSSPQTFAIAGMAGVMAGIVRAPITAILIVFEITGDYGLILPIMLTAVICSFVAERMGTPGIYMLSLIKHGVRLQQGRDIDLMQGMNVKEAMVTPAPTIPHHATLTELRDAFRHYHTRALCVIKDDALIGIVTLGDLQATFENALTDTSLHPEMLTVADICTKNVVTSSADDMLWTAIKNMGARDIGRLPVLDKRGQLVGILRRQDIMQAYNVAVARKLQDQHTAEQVRLHTLTGAHVLEYFVQKGSTLEGKPISTVGFPPECVVASIQRKGKLVVPHGSTVLMGGDTLTVVADEDSEHILNTMFRRT